MKIQDWTTAGASVTQTIEVPFAKFLLQAKAAAPSVIDTTTGSDPVSIVSALTGGLTGAKITVRKQNRDGGLRYLINAVPLIVLLEASAWHEGQMHANYVTGSNGNMQATFEISNHGSLEITNDDKIIIEITNVPTGTQLSLNTIDVPERSATHIDFQEVVVLANQQKTLDVSGSYMMMLPNTGIDTVQMGFVADTNQGIGERSIDYTMEEIQAISRDVDNAKVVGLGKLYPSSAMFFTPVDIGKATRITVRPTANTSIYLVKNVLL